MIGILTELLKNSKTEMQQNICISENIMTGKNLNEEKDKLTPKNFYYYLPFFFRKIKFYAITIKSHKSRPNKFLLKYLYKHVELDRLNIKKRKSSLPIGISIGKNFDTNNDQAFDDYLICMEKVYEYSSYIAINISSPNTENLRELSDKEYLGILLSKIKSTARQIVTK